MDHRKLSRLMDGGSEKPSPRRLLASNHLLQGSKVVLMLVSSWFHGVCYMNVTEVQKTKWSGKPQCTLSAQNFNYKLYSKARKKIWWVQETYSFPSKDAIVCWTFFVGQSACSYLSMFMYMLLLFFLSFQIKMRHIIIRNKMCCTLWGYQFLTLVFLLAAYQLSSKQGKISENYIKAQ